MPESLPAEWASVPVGEVLTAAQYGLSVPMHDVGKYAILRMNAIQDGIATDEGPKFVDLPEEVAHQYLLQRDDVLFNRTNSAEWVGKVGLYRGSEGAVFASYLIRLLPNASRVDRIFLGRLLASPLIQARIRRYATPGVQQVNINATNLQQAHIPLPPLPEQRAIARVLDAADAAIERTRAAVAAARRVKRGLVQTLLTRGLGHTRFQSSPIGEVPDSWSVVRVGDLLTEAQYGLSMPMATKGEYPILRMAAIQDGDVLLNDLKFVDLPAELAGQYLLRRGDILFNRTNSLEHVGKVGVYRSDLPAVFASYLIRLKLKPGVANSYYLGQVLASYAVQCRIRRYATPGVQQVNINAMNLQRVWIAIPHGPTGLAEQERIADILERQDDAVRRLEHRVSLLERLKRGLMQVLLTGKVRLVR